MRVEDTLGIQALLVAYCDAIDRQRFDELDRVFTPDADIDYRQTGGPRASLPAIQAFLTDELRRYRRLQHFSTNVRVSFDDVVETRAQARSYVLAQHGYLVDGRMRFFQLGGEYEDALTRTSGGWRITSRVLHLRFLDGDLPGPRDAAAEASG